MPDDENEEFSLAVQEQFTTEELTEKGEPFDTEDADVTQEMKPNTSDMAIAYVIHGLTKPSPTTSKVHRNFVAFAPIIMQFESNQDKFSGHVIPHKKSMTKIIHRFLSLTPAVGGERAEQLTKIAASPRMMQPPNMPNAIMQESDMMNKPSKWKFWSRGNKEQM
ncbi:MAG: hypothetical protein ACW99A_02875 [Candidatus Kariarchaeaceae archaeon]|jgi:hypothetical protein